MDRSTAEGLEALARIVVEDADAVCRREEDRALNEARRLRMDAEDRIASLRRAAHDLGRTRGEAADAAEAVRADEEIAAIRAGATDALFDRFRARLLIRLRGLADDARYAAALEHWAREAAAVLDGPAEVHAARRDRAAVYAALLVAGAEDFQVHVDHGVHVGFVVRDLDGRTVIDRRPDALVAEHEGALRELLETRVAAFPAEPAPAPGSEPDVSTP